MPLRRWLLQIASAFAAAAMTSADEAGDEAFTRFRSGTSDLGTLAEVLPMLADPERREAIREGILEADPAPPRPQLVSLLRHPLLAVRLGALDLLEELAGGDFGYNPWIPSDEAGNEGTLALWKTWADEPLRETGRDGLFSDEQRRSYLGDVLGEDRDRASRARRMLAAEGLPAVTFLENFLNETATLPAGQRTRVREAQYQTVLGKPLGDQAAVTAQHLAFGSRDQLLSALGSTRSAGLLALPILRDFIRHADPLVRETAIDSLLLVGGSPAVAIVAPILREETDVNVIHGALRRLKDLPGDESLELVGSFLAHSNEDILISAIQSSLSLSDSGSRAIGSEGKESSADPVVIGLLDDPRWRVRATALEYIASKRLKTAAEACIRLLADSDEFVRFAAVKASAALGDPQVLPKMKELFLADESMAGPVMEAYGTMSRQPDAEMLAQLDRASPETRLAALQAVPSHSSLKLLVLRYAGDENLDVACAALRLIAADEDLVRQNSYAGALAAALRSKVAEKSQAVLERLSLPAASRSAALDIPFEPGEPTALDDLYDSFLEPAGQAAARDDAAPPETDGTLAELIEQLALRLTPETAAADRFQAAVSLAAASDSRGYAELLSSLPSLTTAQKIAICQRIGSPTADAIPLLDNLLRDPVSEVRAAAASCALAEEDAPRIIQRVLLALTTPDAVLEAHEVYDYRFEYALRENKPLFRSWCHGVLENAGLAVPVRILAAIASREAGGLPLENALRAATTAPEPHLRRAAWHSLLTLRTSELAASAETIAKDPHAFVREVLPALAGDNRSHHWFHHFNDLNISRDNRWTNDQRTPMFTEPVRTALEELARADPSPLIRFEASLALLARGVAIDFDKFITLVPTLPKETDAVRRIGSWMESNAGRATPALRPLLAVIDPTKMDREKLALLNNRLGTTRTEGFSTFASLAETTAADFAGSGGILDQAEDTETTERDSLPVVYFYKPGCPECLRAKEYLEILAADFPLMELHPHNLLESSGTILNQALCSRFSVPSGKHTLSPAIFTQSGYLIREDISPQALASLFSETLATDQDDTWMELEAVEKQAAEQEVSRRYEALTLPVILIAGLLDGINPCAFATIIFFLSYLQIARRTPREMLMVGAAFISAVFIAYLAAGLLLYQVLASLNDHFAGIQKWMNLSFAALALVAAWLSFRDAFRARGGRIGEMTLQLPGFLKTRIRGVIRESSKARNFVIAAFVAGLIISLLELACTGQVYAPIIYQIQQGSLDAVAWLVAYNLAFIAPLIGIFGLAYGGLRSETLIDFQKKHTFTVKIALGLLFIALAALILFGQKLLN